MLSAKNRVDCTKKHAKWTQSSIVSKHPLLVNLPTNLGYCFLLYTANIAFLLFTRKWGQKCPVDVGGADVEEQASRRTLLGRAIPADLAFAESLIATEYAQFLQGQAVEVRSFLPSSPPEPFRAKRYFSNLEIAVWQREEDEQTEHIISHLPVHPQDGCVDPAEKERRVAWIQKLTAEQIQQVDTLVRHKWQLQCTSAPAWMRGILPADPPAEFWSAEYYACMAELVENLRKQNEVEAVRAASGRDAAEPTLLRAKISDGEAASSLRGAAEPMLWRGRSWEGKAPKDVEAEPAGVVYGMDAIMAGTAYAEDITEPHDDSQVSFIGSLSLLLHAEVGARVHYEGKLVYGDPSPQELPPKEALGSPRKRSFPYNETKEANTVCDILMTDTQSATFS